jgi:uncharacterized protein YbbC (DUF1343 family)
MMKTVLGLDRIDELAPLLGGRKLGLITNYSGVDSRWRCNIDLFRENGFSIVKLFTPEHGLYGATAGEAVGDSYNETYDLPIVSLFGEKLKPIAEDLADVDVCVFDIQDVGLRYYTYLYTLTYAMEAAAENGKAMIVLDRPNPLGGIQVCGGRIREEYDSFIGDYELPVRYGLTLGEMGYYFKDRYKLDLDYRVIRMQNYSRETYFCDTGLLWNIPSPALPTFDATICYSGGCFVGATNISEGRGSTRPFQIYGAPYIDMDRLYRKLCGMVTEEGIAFRQRAFIPCERKYQGEVCYGIEFQPLRKDVDFIPVAMKLMKAVKELHEDKFELVQNGKNRHLSMVTGSTMAEEYLNGSVSLGDVLNLWKTESEEFAKESEAFRIYG